jgi:hypothetical protein
MRHATVWLSLLALLWSPALVHAHKASDSYLSLGQGAGGVAARWDIALRDLDRASRLDGDGDGALTWGEVRTREQDVVASALRTLRLSSRGQPCALRPGPAGIAQHSDGAYLRVPFDVQCGASAVPDALRYDFLFELDAQHRAVVRLSAPGQVDGALVLSNPSRSARIELAAPAKTSMTEALFQGVVHILSGFDHLLFLLALLLPLVRATEIRSALRGVVKVVTAFTCAHSLTLGIAGLGLVSAEARIVEPAIALSVGLAALNNLYPLFGREGWSMAFALGLLHGFGFSSALADAGLAGASLVQTLFAFNLGVELGQLTVVALFVPLALLLCRREITRLVAVRAGSLAILALSVVWVFQRLEQG